MAASDKKRKTKQKHTPSSGEARRSRALRAIVRTKIKINRWKRYQGEVEGNSRTAPKDPKRWNTTGLESHLKNLQAIVKQGKTL